MQHGLYGLGPGASSKAARLMQGCFTAMLVEPASGRCHLGRKIVMAWKTPRIVEVSLALEINSYACAEIG
jgi:coenzyme PQQ precursor peptide PqqA